MLDLRQTPEYVKYANLIGWKTERIHGVNYFIKKFPIIGSFIKIQRPKKIDFNQINRVAKRNRAFQITIEPKDFTYNTRLTTRDFKQNKSPFLPSKTIHIDLTKTEKQLLSQLHPKTRYNIKIAKRNKLKIIRSNDTELFANFWQECSQ